MVTTNERSSHRAKRSKHRADICDRPARHGGRACLLGELMWELTYLLVAVALIAVAVVAVKYTDT
jgi:hypothetical protein